MIDEEFKKEFRETNKKLYGGTEEGEKYLEYFDKTGGVPFCPLIYGVRKDKLDEYGGVIGVYEECIKRGILWDDLPGLFYEIEIGPNGPDKIL